MTYKSFLFILFLCVTNYTSGHPTTLNHENNFKYIPETNSLYKLFKTPMTWENAAAVCEGEGATLFYPKTEMEMNAVVSFFERETFFFPRRLFLGIHRTENGIRTVDDISIANVYSKWSECEPNNQYGVEDCVELAYYYDSETWKYNDIPCGFPSAFLCTATSPMSINNIDDNIMNEGITELIPVNENKQTNGYQKIAGTNAMYKFHESPRSWSCAKGTCEGEGAILFYATSEMEANAVTSFYKNLTENFPNELHVGIERLGCGFRTTDRKHISHAYTMWAPDAPSAKDCVNCVEMTNTTSSWMLNDMPCDKTSAFICKMNLEDETSTTVFQYDNEDSVTGVPFGGIHDLSSVFQYDNEDSVTGVPFGGIHD